MGTTNCLPEEGENTAEKAEIKPKSEDYSSTIEILKEVRLISCLNKNELEELARNLVPRSYKSGDFLMKYGEDGTEFYIIVSGECGILTEDGAQVATLAHGDYVGEMALLEGAKRNATVKCLLDVETLVASKDLFHSVLENSSKIRFEKRTAKRMAVITVVKDFDDEKKRDWQPTEKSEKDIQWLMKSVSGNILFQNLEEKNKLEVIKTMYKETVNKDTVLIRQGDPKAQTFYVIESGSFLINVDGEDVHTFKQPGMCMGELALIHDAPRSATVTALEESVVWTMHRTAYRTKVRAVKEKGNKQRIRWLRQVELFRSLKYDELAMMSKAFDEVKYQPGKLIIKEGDMGFSFYLIKSGQVKWEKSSGEMGTRTAGEYFGERALIKHQKRAATVTTVLPTECLKLSKRDFEDLLGPLVKNMEKKITMEDAKSGEWEAYRSLPKGARGSALLKQICRLSQLKTIGILGKGAFGVVSLVVDPITKNSYALKAMMKCQIVDMGFQDHIVNEKDVMLLLNHNFLVNLRGKFKDKLRVYLLLDVCLGGELFTILRKRRNFDEKTTRFYAACVVEAFAYMHSINVIYRDLKPENLVLDSKGYLKVTDFGFAKQIVDQTYTLCGTPEYFAPEIVTGSGHGKGVDWWTLGILIFEMLAAFSPFYADQAIDIYKRIIHRKLRFPRYISVNAKKLITGFLQIKPTRRLGVLRNGDVNMIREMELFSDFNWEEFQAFEMPAPIKPKVRSPTDISNFTKLREERDVATPIRQSQEFDSTF